MLQPRPHLGPFRLQPFRSRVPTSHIASTRSSAVKRRAYASSADLQLVSGATGKPLPPQRPLAEWEKAYKISLNQGTAERSWLFNPSTAKNVVKSYGLNDGGEPKTVLEVYPGAGVLSRELLTLPRSVLKKLIIMEFSSGFHPELEALAEADDRVTLIKESAFYWQVYQDLQAQGHFDGISRAGFDEVHPSLRLVGHLPMHVLAEQWLSQILRHVADRAWMWQFGRFPIHLLMPARVWRRVYSQGDLYKNERCKLSIIAQAGCDVSMSLPKEETDPYQLHFYPFSRGPIAEKRGSRLAGNPFVAVKVVPRAKPLITVDNIEAWDYVLRQLYASRIKPIEKAIKHLSPGAAILLKSVSFDATKRVNELTPEEWEQLVTAFCKWPFRPETLFQINKKEWDVRADALEGRI